MSDEEWAFAAPYLVLMAEAAPQRRHALREVFNGLRYIVKTGMSWRWMPNDLPPWPAVYQQTQRWVAAGCFEMIAHDLRMLLREADGRAPAPTAAVFDSQTPPSTPESGARAADDGAKRRKGSKVHIAVDTLGYLLALPVTPAGAQDRDQVAHPARRVQEVTGESVEVAFVDQGYTGDEPAAAADAAGIRPAVVKLPAAKKGFGRLARDYERLATTLAGLHLVAFACIALARAAPLLRQVHNSL